jgi:uncharacterized protein
VPAAPPLDLADLPLVDNHCHGLFVAQEPMDADAFRAAFSEHPAQPFEPAHTQTSVHYMEAVRMLAGKLGCTADEASLVAARSKLGRERLERELFADARISWLLIDDGYPPKELAAPREEVAQRSGAHVGWLVRVERLAERIVASSAGFAAFDEELRARLASARERGVCGLKSIAAYRSGLAVSEPDRGEARAAFARMRASGATRLEEKALVDHVVWRTLEAARAQELPVQLHTGYGDADADMRLGDPLHLRAALRAFPDVSIVLLHESWPFTRNAALLAATSANVYVDVAFCIPFLTSAELLACLRAALAAAPAARIMVSSDGVGIPDHYWVFATRARLVLAQALGELVDAGSIDAEQAAELAALIGHRNAERIYRLPAVDAVSAAAQGE